jgi:hypothetical protein
MIASSTGKHYAVLRIVCCRCGFTDNATYLKNNHSGRFEVSIIVPHDPDHSRPTYTQDRDSLVANKCGCR